MGDKIETDKPQYITGKVVICRKNKAGSADMQGFGSGACLDLLTFVLFGRTSYSLEEGN